MSVTFGKNAQAFVKPIEEVTPDPTRTDDPRVAQFEVFGRLNLTLNMMASFFGVGVDVVSALMRRTDIRRAYDRGRAEAVIAVRQKQLSLALTGNITMLTYAGVHFADQQTADTPPPRETNGDRGWDNTLAKRATAIRDRIQGVKEAGGA